MLRGLGTVMALESSYPPDPSQCRLLNEATSKY